MAVPARAVAEIEIEIDVDIACAAQRIGDAGARWRGTEEPGGVVEPGAEGSTGGGAEEAQGQTTGRLKWQRGKRLYMCDSQVYIALHLMT